MARRDWVRSGLRRPAAARLIQSAIGDKLARALIAGEITDGDTGACGPRRGGRYVASQPAAAGCGGSSGLVQHRVVVVFAQAEVVADAVAQPEQQPQLGVIIGPVAGCAVTAC